MACFGMGIRVSKEEKAKLQDVVDLATYAVTVVNDMYSWPKEIKCHLETPGSNAPFNAVAVLMRHNGCSEAEAFRVLRDKQTELEERHRHLLDEHKAREGGHLPGNQELYVLTAQHAVSGSELWSIFSKRYPSKEELGQPEVECVDGVFQFKNSVLLPEDQERYEDARETVEIEIEIEKQLSALHVDVVEITRPITPPASSGGEASRPSTSGLSNAAVAFEDKENHKVDRGELEPAANVEPITSGLLPSSGVGLVTYASRIEAAPEHVGLPSPSSSLLCYHVFILTIDFLGCTRAFQVHRLAAVQGYPGYLRGCVELVAGRARGIDAKHQDNRQHASRLVAHVSDFQCVMSSPH